MIYIWYALYLHIEDLALTMAQALRASFPLEELLLRRGWNGDMAAMGQKGKDLANHYEPSKYEYIIYIYTYTIFIYIYRIPGEHQIGNWSI